MRASRRLTSACASPRRTASFRRRAASSRLDASRPRSAARRIVSARVARPVLRSSHAIWVRPSSLGPPHLRNAMTAAISSKSRKIGLSRFAVKSDRPWSPPARGYHVVQGRGPLRRPPTHPRPAGHRTARPHPIPEPAGHPANPLSGATPIDGLIFGLRGGGRGAMRGFLFLVLLGVMGTGATQERECYDPETSALRVQKSACPFQSDKLYRCPGADGVATYQSFPCTGTPADKTWDAVDRYKRPSRPAEAPVRRSQSTSAGRTHTRAGASESRLRDMRCAAAKQHRDETLKRVGLARTFDLLRQLDDQVDRACKP